MNRGRHPPSFLFERKFHGPSTYSVRLILHSGHTRCAFILKFVWKSNKNRENIVQQNKAAIFIKSFSITKTQPPLESFDLI